MDGVLRAQLAAAGTVAADSGPLTIGRDDDWPRFGAAFIDEVAIYDKASRTRASPPTPRAQAAAELQPHRRRHRLELHADLRRPRPAPAPRRHREQHSRQRLRHQRRERRGDALTAAGGLRRTMTDWPEFRRNPPSRCWRDVCHIPGAYLVVATGGSGAADLVAEPVITNDHEAGTACSTDADTVASRGADSRRAEKAHRRLRDGVDTLSVPGHARWGVSGSLNPSPLHAGPNAVQGAVSSGLDLWHVVLTDRVPRTGSVRTASGPEGSSAKDSLSGAAAPPDPSRRRGYLRGCSFRRRSA